MCEIKNVPAPNKTEGFISFGERERQRERGEENRREMDNQMAKQKQQREAEERAASNMINSSMNKMLSQIKTAEAAAEAAKKRAAKERSADKNPNTAHHIITGQELVDGCSVSQSRTTNAMGEAVNLHKTFGRYNDQQSVVNNKANQLQNRINEILNSRRALGHENNSSSRKLMSELAQYQNEYQTLKRLNVGQDTLNGMAEDSLLKHGSSRIKYLVWLGLAICVLMVVIRKTK